jgi:hypothetical protein
LPVVAAIVAEVVMTAAVLVTPGWLAPESEPAPQAARRAGTRADSRIWELRLKDIKLLTKIKRRSNYDWGKFPKFSVFREKVLRVAKLLLSRLLEK